MKAFNLRLDTLVLRFYLMMAVVILAGFTGQWALAFLALPIFLSCMWGLVLAPAVKESKMKKAAGRVETRTHRIHMKQSAA